MLCGVACGDAALRAQTGARDGDDVECAAGMLAVVALDGLLQASERFEILVAL